MTSPTFCSRCGCGALWSTPCEMHEIPAATARLAADGWGHDARGRVRCPACLARPQEPARREVTTHEAPAQAELFGEAAA